MIEQIKKILRKRITSDDKIILIIKLINGETINNYGFNKLVKLNDKEIKKLNKMYGKQVINNMIESLDTYIYTSGKIYKSHYSTILSWIRKAGIKKIPQTYICPYGEVHRKGSDCDCI